MVSELGAGIDATSISVGVEVIYRSLGPPTDLSSPERRWRPLNASAAVKFRFLGHDERRGGSTEESNLTLMTRPGLTT